MECDCTQYYVMAVWESSLIPLGSFTKEWAEFTKKLYEKENKYKPGFKYVSIR